MIDPLGGISEPAPPEAEAEPQRTTRPPRPTTWALLLVIAVAFLVGAMGGLAGLGHVNR